MATYRGIDVSRWQGGIDWNKVKASGVQFAMLRASYGKGLDAKFKDNLSGAKTAGLEVGIYHFTTATTPAEAEQEIDWLFSQLGGEQLGYPVAFDMEDEGNRYTGKTAAQLTDIAAAALARIEQHGYFAMLYTNPDWLQNRLEAARLKQWDVWLAAWRTSRPTGYAHGIWQYTSSGSVPGIAGAVDLDTAYKNYPAIMAHNGLNGWNKQEQAQSPSAQPEVLYSVKKGRHPVGIAISHGTTVEVLAALNGLKNPDLIFPGQTLRLPEGGRLDVNHVKAAYYGTLAALSAAGSAVANLLGGWDAALQTLCIMMAADYLTGVVCALVWKKSPKTTDGAYESKASIKGLFRKAGILLAVLVAYQLDALSGTDFIRTSTILFFTANDGLSVLENLGLMGLPIPQAVKNAFEVLRDKSGTKEK